jgi:hypothetical protein
MSRVYDEQVRSCRADCRSIRLQKGRNLRFFMSDSADVQYFNSVLDNGAAGQRRECRMFATAPDGACYSTTLKFNPHARQRVRIENGRIEMDIYGVMATIKASGDVYEVSFAEAVPDRLLRLLEPIQVLQSA